MITFLLDCIISFIVGFLIGFYVVPKIENIFEKVK
jgi:uncharacterized protein YneF (UPF0154 family)